MTWIITDEHNPSGCQWAKNGRIHINALKLCAVFLGILTNCQVKLEVYYSCQAALQQVHILIINLVLNPKYAIKLQNKCGYDVLNIIL